MELKVGDKVIYTHSSRYNMTISIRTIVKVNKDSYKLDNESLITKDLKRKGKCDSFSTVTEKYEIYTTERWNELESEINDRRYKEWVERLTRERDLNIEFMKRYVEEKESETK